MESHSTLCYLRLLLFKPTWAACWGRPSPGVYTLVVSYRGPAGTSAGRVVGRVKPRLQPMFMRLGTAGRVKWDRGGGAVLFIQFHPVIRG